MPVPRHSKRVMRTQSETLPAETPMGDGPRISYWLAILLFTCAAPALGKTYELGIGDDCDPGSAWPSPYSQYQDAGACFFPAILTINAGDSVHFYQYAELFFTGPHNVVA